MNKKDFRRNYFMLDGRFAKKGYDWWWHNFTAVDEQTGEEKPFFIEYFTINPEHAKDNGGEEPVLGQKPENQQKGQVPSYVMLKCGWWGTDATQLHRFIPWKEVSVSNTKNGYQLVAPDCCASETYLTGKVHISEAEAAAHPEWMCNAGSMEFDIHASKEVAFNVGYGASALFRKLKAFEMYWHAEGMKTSYSGTITANGRKYKVLPETSFGYADKNWGSNFTSPWVWLSSNDLVSKITGQRLQNSVFDIGGGCPKVFGIPLKRKLLSDFFYEGKSYEFNFSKFWTFCRTKFDCQETDTQILWKVRQETVRYIMETTVASQKDQMLLVNYEAPDGTKRHNRLWNGGNAKGSVQLYKKTLKGKKLLDDLDAAHIGCEFGEYTK